MLGIAWAAGLASLAGGFLGAPADHLKPDRERTFERSMAALGGGVLLGAVAFALLPEGIQTLSAGALSVTFLAGGIAFALIDSAIQRSGSPRAQFLALLSDFVPEAISLGAVFAHDRRMGMLLGGFIAAQNLPEGFNAFREMKEGGQNPKMVLWTLAGCSLMGPLAAGIGLLFLQDAPLTTAAIMTFASGGILYLVFQDIAPQAHQARRWAPTLGAVVGMLIGALGHQWLG
jgi:ZIP family zinc transporter